MIIISQFIDFLCYIGGPRFAHEVQLRRIERWRNFEPEYFLLDQLVDPNRSSLDVGANEGIYAARLSQLSPRVHCFEPIPWLAAGLRQRLRSSVTIHELVASNRTGQGELRIPYRDHVEMHGTSTIEERNPLSEATHVQAITCKLARLDDQISDPVGFIKIDVEGHELAVLEGAGEIISRDRPVLLVESEKRHNMEAPECIFEFLRRQGYFGIFLENGKLRALSNFETITHQRPEHLDGTRKIGTYINNFIFIPG